MTRRALVALLLLASGCMRYAPRADLAPPARAQVQLLLDQPRSVALGDVTVNNVVQVEGWVQAADPREIRLNVAGLRLANGVAYPANGEEVGVPAGWVSRVSERRLAVARSLAATGAVVALAALLQAAFAAEGGGGGSVGRPRPGQ